VRSRATLRLAFADAEEAARLAAALEPENDAFLRARVEGATLVADVEADEPLALLRTLDDALACLGAAQRAARAAGPRRP
jgi:hypothetical protein